MSIPAITDFPDRLSPMLVKELRQGLRAKTFVAVFLSLQVILLLILLTATASTSSANAGSVISVVIFTFFSIAVLVVQPLRGIGAISSEVKGNTIDMMVLTRLSARRIVHGKWFAIVSQSALIFATIIPYLIFRYFFGKMNLVGEIVLLMLIFLTSMAVTAITVGLSGSSSVILRALLPILAIPILAYASLIFMFSHRFGGGSSLADFCTLDTDQSRAIVGAYLLIIGYLGWSLLSLGISFIAPAAENHSTLRRLIILGVAGLAAFFMTTPYVDEDFLPFLFAIICLPAIGTALTERSHLPPGINAPFAERGIPGRIAGLFLAPGWPSGVFFSILLSSVFLAVMYLGGIPHWTDGHQIVIMAILGTLLFPALVLALFRSDETSRVSVYILLLIALGVFTMVIYGIVESLNNDELLWFFVWNPLTFLPILEENPDGHEMAPLLSAMVTGLYFSMLATLAVFTMNRMRKAGEATEATETP